MGRFYLAETSNHMAITPRWCGLAQRQWEWVLQSLRVDHCMFVDGIHRQATMTDSLLGDLVGLLRRGDGAGIIDVWIVSASRFVRGSEISRGTTR
jgi:hypothetical protein